MIQLLWSLTELTPDCNTSQMKQKAGWESRAARPGSKRLIREINEALVLDTLRSHGPTSRAGIAELTGLSAATVTGISSKLAHEGLVHEKAPAMSPAVGRPARPLELNRTGAWVIGSRIKRDRLISVALNMAGETVGERTLPLRDTRPDTVVEGMRVLTDDFSNDLAPRPLRGHGVALSGVVDRHNGFVRHSGLLGWENIPLGAMLFGALNVPIRVDKNVNALTSQLLLFGSAHVASDLIVITVDSSIGMAIVVDKRIVRGADGAAGGLAHTTGYGFDDANHLCHCDKQGCLETIASGWGIAQSIKNGNVGVRIADDVESLVHGQPEPVDRLRAAGSLMASVAANLVLTHNPHQILITGELTKFQESFVETLKRRYHVLTDSSAVTTELVVLELQANEWARGAASQILAEMFQAT